MLRENLHVPDQELLLAADGELSSRRTAQVRAHLAACWDCRARMAEIEGTITDFARAHRQTLDPQLPPSAGPRALLKAQLAELAAQPKANSWRSLFQSLSATRSTTRAAALLCVTVLIVAAVGRLLVQDFALGFRSRRTNSAAASFERGAVPDRNLTPGATRAVTISDVCSMPHEEVVKEVSTSLRQEVLHEYGIVNANKDDYEIDYLIAPGLGGKEDIHNLWPEPSTSRDWNSQVKDALEEHLHQMVCAGKLDLSTAQHDIASNWITAYKKYFYTDKPIQVFSPQTSGRPGIS
jgi:Putative zinc-finger